MFLAASSMTLAWSVRPGCPDLRSRPRAGEVPARGAPLARAVLQEVRDVGLAEGEAVLLSLTALGDRRGGLAARALAELPYRHNLERACEALIWWANERPASVRR
jgi:hypothetical protein